MYFFSSSELWSIVLAACSPTKQAAGKELSHILGDSHDVSFMVTPVSRWNFRFHNAAGSVFGGIVEAGSELSCGQSDSPL